MNVHLFVNRESPNELKFFILPISVLAWIKSINGSDNTWKQEVPNNIKEDLLEIGFKSIPKSFEVSYFNYENEILNEMLKNKDYLIKNHLKFDYLLDYFFENNTILKKSNKYFIENSFLFSA